MQPALSGEGVGLDELCINSFTFTGNRIENLISVLHPTLHQSGAQGKRSLRGVTSSTESLVFPVALNLTSPIPAKHDPV